MKRSLSKGFFWTFLQNNNEQLKRDPVCGMRINPEDAAGETIYKGRIFYFCAPGCKSAFEKEPEKFFTNLKNDLNAKD